MSKNLKKLVAEAVIAGVLSLTALQLGVGVADAKPHGPDIPWIPGPGHGRGWDWGPGNWVDWHPGKWVDVDIGDWIPPWWWFIPPPPPPPPPPGSYPGYPAYPGYPGYPGY
jgi:hypothetical protein